MAWQRIIGIALVLTAFSGGMVGAQEKVRIGLQDIHTREVVNCYDNNRYSAEDCAKYFESQGFIRMKYIPSKPAGFDYLTVETYPTRRWREHEITPRW